MSSWTTAAAAAVLILVAMPAGAQTPKDGDDALPPQMLAALSPGTFVEQFVATTLRPLREADVAGDGLDRGDLELAAKRASAQVRSQNVAALLLLDLDGDDRVTRDEREIANRLRRGAAGRSSEQMFARWDVDGDGVATLQEVLAAKTSPTSMAGRRGEILEVLMLRDRDGDGKVSAAELEAAARGAFAKIDANGDLMIGEDEYKRVRASLVTAMNGASAISSPCQLPAPGKDDQIVAFGVYEGDAMPTATVAGQDKETSTASLVIEPGDAPLYVVVSSYDAMIWRVTGATSRVARLVLISSQEGAGGMSAAGATGLPHDKVTIAPAGACFRYYKTPDAPEGLQARNVLTRELGRAPAAMGGAYGVISVSAPSMTSADVKASRDPNDTPAGFDPRTWRDAARFTPGGVVEIDPATVVAATPAAAYEVLPGQMGLARLVASGEIERANRQFRVVKPIPRFPAGLAGAHAVSFVIAQGVPAPKGNSGHSCVAYEDPAGPDPAGPMCGRR